MFLGIHIVLTFVVIRAGRPGAPLPVDRLLVLVGVIPAHFRPYTLLTYSFFHEGLLHLLANLFFVWVFGSGMEEAIGRWRFLALYVAGGAVGAILQVLVTNALLPTFVASRPIIGASAACTALMGLYAVRYYRARLAFVGMSWRPHVVAVVGVCLAYEVIGALWSLQAGDGADSVAHWAHIGGFVFGLTIGQVMRLDVAAQLDYLTSDAATAMEKSDPGEAIRRLETLLAREPENLSARVELARAWILLGDTENSSGHYVEALRGYLGKKQRDDAVRLYGELREHYANAGIVPVDLLFPLGLALEESERAEQAAEILRSVTVRCPNALESETALLKVINLYIFRLDRRDEGAILARLFLERYPQSPFRNLAEDLRREVS